MISLLINFLILVIVLAVLYWIIQLLVGLMGLPPVVMKIAQVILALIVLIWLLQILGGYAGSGPRPYFWRWGP